jgi:uncharacterized protein (UPF0332 family)
MPRAARTSEFWKKAGIAARSARHLLKVGDADGATNRAYYAIFGAARAALFTVRPALAQCKRHATIVRRFDKHLVAERGLDRSFDTAFFHRQQNARWIADYDVASVGAEKAQLAIGDMEAFLAAVEPLVKQAPP